MSRMVGAVGQMPVSNPDEHVPSQTFESREPFHNGPSGYDPRARAATVGILAAI